MSVELFLSYDEHLDWLTLIEFGQVENAQPRDHWNGVIESFGYLLRYPEGPEIGFKILDFSKFDPEDPEVSEIWEGPRFDVPVLGLRDSTAGEIVLAAHPRCLTVIASISGAKSRASISSSSKRIHRFGCHLQVGDCLLPANPREVVEGLFQGVTGGQVLYEHLYRNASTFEHQRPAHDLRISRDHVLFLHGSGPPSPAWVRTPVEPSLLHFGFTGHA